MNENNIETLCILGMIFWFAPFCLSLTQYPNFDVVGTISILMLVISILGSFLFSSEFNILKKVIQYTKKVI